MISFRRLYHVSCSMYSFKKQGIKLCKMINPRKNRQWYPLQSYENDTLPSVKSLTKMKYEPGKRSTRRVSMLNKIFMKQITDLMSTGTMAMDLVGRGIEISKVNVTPDFQTVNVFWVCKGNSTDEETEVTLNKIAGALRHELSTLRVMGEVPYIVFVKDKLEARLVDLDRRLSTADYGEDFIPTEIGHLLKTEFTLDTKLSPEMKLKIKQLEEEQPIIEEAIPDMTHNVYGLDHSKILSRLLAARKKTRDAWSSLEENPTVISYRTPSEKGPEPDVSDQRKELADFLLKRKILQDKLHKQLRNTSESWQLEHKDDDDDDEMYYSDENDDYPDHDEYYYENDEQHNQVMESSKENKNMN